MIEIPAGALPRVPPSFSVTLFHRGVHAPRLIRMTGFVLSNHQVWGRPVGIAMGADGSLYVSEDGNNAVYCVSYTG